MSDFSESGAIEQTAETALFVFYGYNFSDTDNQQYLAPVPATATVGSNVSMSLENMFLAHFLKFVFRKLNQ